MLAISFVTAPLLLGLLATMIPLALHLLARSRAQEVPFPTLRFLRMSMEKTARRRRIQNLLLMLLRMALMALLALSVSEPVSEAIGGWTGGSGASAVLIVDNSMSMGALAGGPPAKAAAPQIRLDRAKEEAQALLSGDQRPAVAALMVTNGEAPKAESTGRLEGLRDEIDRIGVSGGRAPLAQDLAAAINLLRAQTSYEQRNIYIFSDLQKASFDELAKADNLAEAANVHLLVINTADRRANNVGVTDVAIDGQRVVDQVLSFTATVVNSSPTDRVVDVGLRIDGKQAGPMVRQSLRPGGKEGCTASVRFYHPIEKAGPVTGEVFIDSNDDLMMDNQRRFCLSIGGRVRALVVRGPVADVRQPITDPAMMLNLALDPFTDKTIPWSITPQTVGSDEFSPSSLNAVDVAFFSDVPKFSPEQARAMEDFASAGGTVVVFLGPDVDAANYNERLVAGVKAEGGLLPFELGAPEGEVGPTAKAHTVRWIDLEHGYFKGLYASQGDLKDELRGFVQRYFKTKETARPGMPLIKLDNDDPVLAVKQFGRGRVVLCTTSASPGWSNLPATTMFLPMIVRMSLLSRQETAHSEDTVADSQVLIRLPIGPQEANEIPVTISVPAGRAETQPADRTIQAVKTAEGYIATFSDTSRLGIYQWHAGGESDANSGAFGAFAVNPVGAESDLQSMTSDDVKAALAAKGLKRVYSALTVKDVHAAALADAERHNWWDLLLALAVIILVAEALVSNRFRKGAEPMIPAALQARAA